MIKPVLIRNFKLFRSFSLDLNRDLNIVVGDNEAGKSTILETIALALTRRTGGKLIDYELSPFLFNAACADEYLKGLKAKKNPPLPSILIELYLEDEPGLAALRGSNNSRKTDAIGVKLEIEFDEDYKDEYAKLLDDVSEKNVIPAEYFPPTR
jgi:predicted ATP-dependent endonuclease of OLD family